MANIDIAERLFVYAREKQQKDLANNLIKEEDVIDFSSADFNSFNQEISNMLGGMDNEQVNLFVNLLQTKMDHNITDVITPGEKGFSLNLSVISSTINQVKEQSKNIENPNFNRKQDPNSNSDKTKSEREIKETALFDKIQESSLKDIDELSKYGKVSEAFIKVHTAKVEEKGKIFNSYTPEEKEEAVNDAKRNIGVKTVGEPDLGADFFEMIIRRLGLPKELLDKINSNSKLKTHFEFFATDIAAQISDGNILKKGFIDPEALEIYCQKLKSSVTDPEIASLVDIIQHSPGIHGLAITLKRADFREGLINNNRYSKKDSYYNNYDRVNNRSKLSLKYSSLLRQSLGFVDKLPDSIEGKINEFVKKYSYLDPKDCLDMMIKEFDEEEIKQNFTFDIESNPDLVEQTGKRGFDTSYFSNEEIKETGRALLSQLPDTFINIVNKTKEASQILNSLKYTEEDLKAIKPFLEKFTKTGINIPDSDLCYLLNTNTRRYSAYTHVDTETLLQSIAAYSSALKVEFLPEGHDFVTHSTDLSEALNKISTNRSEELIAKSSFENFQEMLNYDICHFAFEDLKYDDIQNALGKEEEKIKLAKAYDKLYPSQSALKSGFKFDFDALLIRMSRLKAKSQLDIYTNPINNSRFITFATALSMLYRNGNKNIISTIDISQQEKNLEVLKKEFLKDFDQSLLDSITLKNMEPIIDALITNVDPRTGQKIETATALSTHVNLMHFEEYENFINNTGKIGLDLDHPGFLTPESYKAYRELNSSHDLSDYNKSINDISSQPEVEPIQEEKVSSISVNQESNNLKNEDFQTKVTSSEDIHPAVQDAPKGVVGFISSFVKKFRSTDKESGLVNRIKESFTYANNVINDYSELDKVSNSESDNYKPNQNTEAVNHEQLDSFSQSISVRDSNGNYEPKNNNNSNNKTQEDNSSRAQDDDSEINI